ncbi:protein unc-93 homolog A isoform X3 [Aptenodytes patagonicus]|uniref:protein unc-93 homolog A isoform X3 n=1 Tax=Aptenodytes patagonicus TaxID=9234 RepID=UPI003FA0F9E3
MERNLKNVLVISFGFLLLFTAYGGLQSLQSSLHSEEGLGVASLSVVYAALILSSMFLPPILIKKLGCKWTITGSMCCYIAFSLGNFYASWYTLIPTSVILGLGGAPLWSAKCTYLTIAGNSYAEKAGKNGKDIINQYFGVFFLIFQSSGIWGNLISSLIFSQASNKATIDETPSKQNAKGLYQVQLSPADLIAEISEENLACCGAYDCMTDTTNTTGSAEPSNSLIYTLLGIYTASGVLAVLLIVIFLDQIKSDQAETEKEVLETPSFCSTFLATFQHLKDKRQCLLIPLTMYSGFEQGFLSGDYTKTYVTCALGIHYVGYVMICFSSVNSLCSLLFGKISQFTGRKLLFALVLTESRPFLLLTPPHQRVGWGCTRSWEGTEPGQLTANDQRDNPHHMTSCSAYKAGGRRRKGGRSDQWRLSSQVTITHDGALLSWRWLNTCLPMGRSE